MKCTSAKLTVFFEEPFWVGIFEREEKGMLSVCKVVFGAEPRDEEIFQYILKNYSKLHFSPAVETKTSDKIKNFKRRQRIVKKSLVHFGTSTKSQQAIQQQREMQKMERKQKKREQREEEKDRRFKLKQQKKKEKRNGH